MMLDQIDLQMKLRSRSYKQQLGELQLRLYELEQALYEARIPTLCVVEGWAGTGKIQLISLLTRRLDPRWLRVHPITPPRTYEQQFPWLYRFWLKTPSDGHMALFDRSWYREVVAGRVGGAFTEQVWQERCKDIVAFERLLADSGVSIMKFWLHISKKEQGRRFKKLRGDRLTAWQVSEEDEWQHKHYDEMHTVVEDLLLRTDTPHAPWVALPSTDDAYARIMAFTSIIATLEARLGRAAEATASPPQPAPSEPEATSPITVSASAQPSVTILSKIDLRQTLSAKSYEQKLAQLQAKLHLLGREVYLQQGTVVLVFEGWDAAGKGGAIRRITEKLDPRSAVVHAIAAPSGEDREHHYLYRFWRRLPPRGMFAIFDRSWYGRVLVERVEGFARADEWQRAYAEINEFERQLMQFGTIICKFWLHLSPDEQLRRFEERQNIPYKAWKLTDEDWRNREKWPQYEQAADEMLLRTSTPDAPWTIVEAEDKRFARIKTLQTIVRRLEDTFGKVKL